MTRWIPRIIRLLAGVSVFAIDRVAAPCWMTLQTVERGRNCRFAGIPVINLVPGARIRLGSHVALLSRFNSNPRGVQNPVILSAMKRGAVIEIGDFSGLSGTSICARERVTIGRHVQIGPGVCIWDNDAHSLDPDRRRDRSVIEHRSAPVFICDDVFIGTRAMILKGIEIGQGAVIGAGAVVTKSVSPYDIVAGNPARVIGNVRHDSKVSSSE